jgi:hypothetical protein
MTLNIGHNSTGLFRIGVPVKNNLLLASNEQQSLTARGASLDSGNEKDYGMHRDDS